MMCKLYDHVSAPDSVAVLSLSGSLLGYVPHRHTHRFVHDTNFGHVYAINQDAAGLWRLTVSIRPVLGVCMQIAWFVACDGYRLAEISTKHTNSQQI